jgi:prepilin peptidase CpaA
MSNYLEILPTAAVLLVGLAACAFDVRWRRIPNALTFGAAAGALVFHTALAGFSGLQAALLGWIVGTALFLPFFLLGGMGGGDVKLLAALGAWLGAGDAVWLAIYGSIAGGALAIGYSLVRGYLGTALRNIGALLRYWSVVGPRPMPTLTLDGGNAPRLAFALPMLVGLMVTLWVRS